MPDMTPNPVAAGLLPCPFCGGEADLSFEHSTNHPSWFKVTCLTCGCRTMSNTNHREKVISAWNRRAALSPETLARLALVDRMAEALRPFSDMAGELFARNYNREDQVLGFEFDGQRVTLKFADFLAARAILNELEIANG